MPTNANPEVVEESGEELEQADKGVSLETEERAPAEAAIAPDSEANVRRSRREGTKPTKVDLTAIPEFREWQANNDREKAELKRQAEDARAERQQYAMQQAAGQQAALEQQLDQTVDPAERGRLNAQLLRIGIERERAWSQYFDKQIRDRGMDPTTWDFAKYRDMGQPGAMLFERDLTAAENKKLRQELEETKKAASSRTVEEMVNRKLAAALHAQGLNAVDVAAPEGEASDDELPDDLVRLKSGKMTPAAFKKKYGGR